MNALYICISLSALLCLNAIIFTGNWADEGLFRSYLSELLSDHMPPIVGVYSLEDVIRVRIYSHSGAYYVIGNMATVGGVDQVYELSLLDSLYTNFDQFDAFVFDHLNAFGSTSFTQYRFSSLYTSDGGTLANNVAMEDRVKGWTSDANMDDELLVSHESHVFLNATTISRYSIIFKFVDMSHNDVPRQEFYEFLVGAI